MSYNEIPNILVDSVVLSNQPLSNLEIIDAAKKLSLCGFRGVFLKFYFDSYRLQSPGEVIANILQ